MISINEKSLTVPYCLSRVEFLRQFYMHANERKIKGTKFTLADYTTIIGPRGTKIFNLERYENMQLQIANALAIAVGLQANPPIVVEPIIYNNLPQTQPDMQEAVPNTMIAIERFKIEEKIYEDFYAAKAELKRKMQSMLPSEIFTSLERSKGIQGWSIVDPADVFEYILSDKFGTITADELTKAQDKVKMLWNKSKSLRSNLEDMMEANESIGATFAHMRLDDQMLFQIAYNIALNPNYDLVDTVNAFMAKADQSLTTSLFPDFMAYILEHYPKIHKVPGREHLAFSCEARYKSKAYGMAAIEDAKDGGGLALAANAPQKPSAAGVDRPPSWEPYTHLIQLLLEKRKPTKPSPSLKPGTTQLGKICFLCGWNSDHNSKSCPTMQNAPAGTYTEKQMNLTRFSPTKNPHSIDGKPINQKCAPGVHGWP